eukprot:2672780-Rhodomonas_salina.1
MGKRGNGETGKWGNGEMGKWGNGALGCLEFQKFGVWSFGDMLGVVSSGDRGKHPFSTLCFQP